MVLSKASGICAVPVAEVVIPDSESDGRGEDRNTSRGENVRLSRADGMQLVAGSIGTAGSCVTVGARKRVRVLASDSESDTQVEVAGSPGSVRVRNRFVQDDSLDSAAASQTEERDSIASVEESDSELDVSSDSSDSAHASSTDEDQSDSERHGESPPWSASKRRTPSKGGGRNGARTRVCVQREGVGARDSDDSDDDEPLLLNMPRPVAPRPEAAATAESADADGSDLDVPLNQVSSIRFF
jgi:hypothetical protein